MSWIASINSFLRILHLLAMWVHFMEMLLIARSIETFVKRKTTSKETKTYFTSLVWPATLSHSHFFVISGLSQKLNIILHFNFYCFKLFTKCNFTKCNWTDSTNIFLLHLCKLKISRWVSFCVIYSLSHLILLRKIVWIIMIFMLEIWIFWLIF